MAGEQALRTAVEFGRERPAYSGGVLGEEMALRAPGAQHAAADQVADECVVADADDERAGGVAAEPLGVRVDAVGTQVELVLHQDVGLDRPGFGAEDHGLEQRTGRMADRECADASGPQELLVPQAYRDRNAGVRERRRRAAVVVVAVGQQDEGDVAKLQALRGERVAHAVAVLRSARVHEDRLLAPQEVGVAVAHGKWGDGRGAHAAHRDASVPTPTFVRPSAVDIRTETSMTILFRATHVTLRS